MLLVHVQVLNYIAGGREISSGVSYVCQSMLRGPAAPLVKRLAYDVVHTAALTDADWDAVIEGLKSDLAGTFSLEVCALPRSFSLYGALQSSMQLHLSMRSYEELLTCWNHASAEWP